MLGTTRNRQRSERRSRQRDIDRLSLDRGVIMSVQPASSHSHTVPVARPGPDRAVRAGTVNASLLTVGLVAAVSGIFVEVAMGFLHPSHAQPNDSAAAFEEYSHSQDWTYVHIGQ